MLKRKGSKCGLFQQTILASNLYLPIICHWVNLPIYNWVLEKKWWCYWQNATLITKIPIHTIPNTSNRSTIKNIYSLW